MFLFVCPKICAERLASNQFDWAVGCQQLGKQCVQILGGGHQLREDLSEIDPSSRIREEVSTLSSAIRAVVRKTSAGRMAAMLTSKPKSLSAFGRLDLQRSNSALLVLRDCAAGGPRLQIHPFFVGLGKFYGGTELCGGGNRTLDMGDPASSLSGAN